MAVFGGRDPEEVREILMENGSICGHRDDNGAKDCDVIIQSDSQGSKTGGISDHWMTVHKDG